MKPRPTLASVLAKLDEIGEQRHREAVERLVPSIRPSCELHGWTAPGPGSMNRDAVASLCPGCREDRKRRAREQATPATEVLELWKGDAYAQRLWEETQRRMESAGYVLPNSGTEKLSLQAMDELRREELFDLAETPADRRRANAAYWHRRLRGRTKAQVYTPHPARAGR